MDEKQNQDFDDHLDKAPDVFLDNIQRFEQIEVHLEQMTKLLGLYYNGLIAESVPPQLAGIMAQQYAAIITSNGF